MGELGKLIVAKGSKKSPKVQKITISGNTVGGITNALVWRTIIKKDKKLFWRTQKRVKLDDRLGLDPAIPKDLGHGLVAVTNATPEVVTLRTPECKVLKKPSQRHIVTFKMASFCLIFGLFRQQFKFIRCHDSNSQPHDHEANPITTSPLLQPRFNKAKLLWR